MVFDRVWRLIWDLFVGFGYFWSFFDLRGVWEISGCRLFLEARTS